ncbi:MAG: PspC domain-containing protein [Chloroflexi bacterium]|nr:PspC domain-containing protein [Chloroflexota bacterium]
MGTKMYRSQSDKMIAGVCGGLGRYLGIDSTLVRIFFLLLGLANGGIALLLYFILWIAMPLEGQPGFSSFEDSLRSGTSEMADRVRTFGSDVGQTLRDRPRDVGLIIGVALVLLGGLFLLDNLNLPWLRWFNADMLWPALLILGGLVLLFRQTRR